MAKKRTSLDAIGLTEAAAAEELPPVETPKKQSRRPGIKQQTAYLPDPVYEQLRRLAFEERRKMHDYILEGLDRVFKDRGLKSISDITRRR